MSKCGKKQLTQGNCSFKGAATSEARTAERRANKPLMQSGNEESMRAAQTPSAS